MATLMEIFPVILLPLHTGCVNSDDAGIPGLSFFSVFIISCWFSSLSVASWKFVDSFRWNCAGFWCLFIVFCTCYFLLLPTQFPVFWGAEEDKRYFAYSYHYKERFLLSVPCCCSVITDILKKQRKKITGFLLGSCTAGYSSFGLGRIWQQEEKCFLRSARESSKCVGLCLACLWDLPKHKGEAFMALPWPWSVGQSSPCGWCCWKLAGAKGAISRHNGAGIWSGLHRQGSLVQGADPALGMFPWEMCWALNAFSALRVDLCVGFTVRDSQPLCSWLTLDLDTRALLCFDCQRSLSRWSFCPFKVISALE